MDHDNARALIKFFLELNPEPSDQQFHALAEAIGMDKEELESVAYEMLGQAVTADLLDDPSANPDEYSLQDLAMNDGDPTADDLGYQQETDDDGTDVLDMGVGLTPSDSADVLTDDGIPS